MEKAQAVLGKAGTKSSVHMHLNNLAWTRAFDKWWHLAHAALNSDYAVTADQIPAFNRAKPQSASSLSWQCNTQTSPTNFH